MEIQVTTEESNWVKKEKKHTVSIPAYWVDEYGQHKASVDGKTTLVIGLNGIQLRAKGSHSVETYDYVCSSVAEPKSRHVTKETFLNALRQVEQYCQQAIKSLT